LQNQLKELVGGSATLKKTGIAAVSSEEGRLINDEGNRKNTPTRGRGKDQGKEKERKNVSSHSL